MRLIPAAKSVLVGAVAVGALSLGTAGVAGAASPTSAPATPAAIQRFNCANATKVLTHIQKVESRIAAGLPKLKAAEAKASAAGNTRRADRLAKRIARLESAKVKNRLTRASSAIETKCNVPAPS